MTTGFRLSLAQIIQSLLIVAAVLCAWGDLKAELKTRLALVEYRLSVLEARADRVDRAESVRRRR